MRCIDVYRHSAAGTWGALDRSEAYWRWLVGRKAHDELIVAIHGRDDWDVLERPAHIVGYAVTRGSQVIELATLPDVSPSRRSAARKSLPGRHRTRPSHDLAPRPDNRRAA